MIRENPLEEAREKSFRKALEEDLTSVQKKFPKLAIFFGYEGRLRDIEEEIANLRGYLNLSTDQVEREKTITAIKQLEELKKIVIKELQFFMEKNIDRKELEENYNEYQELINELAKKEEGLANNYYPSPGTGSN